MKVEKEVPIEYFYALKIRPIFRHFLNESFAFKMVCAYLFFEYYRPQSIYGWLAFIPWTQLAVVGAILGFVFGNERKWVSSPINKGLIFWFVLILLSSWHAIEPEISFSVLKNSYSWIIIYFIIVNIVNTRRRFLIFLFIFLLTSFKLSFSLALTWAVRGFSFTTWGLMGPPGFFQNSGELAIQMIVFWPLAWAIAKSFRNYLPKWKYYILTAMPVTAMMVVLGSSSRGGQLALIFQILFKNLKFVLRLKVIASVLLVGASIWYVLPPEQKMRFENIGQDVSSKQRIFYWENGFKMMQSHPWLGVGYYNYIPYYEKYYPEDMLYSKAELPHNIFIQVGADLGYPALVLYLSMIIYVYLKTKAIKKSLRSQGKDPLFVNILDGLNISLVGFVVAGQFVSVVYYPFLWIHFAIFVSCENIIIKEMVAGEKRARKAVSFAGAQGVEGCDRLQRPEP